MTTNLEIAERLFAAIMRGDVAAVGEVYAPDCVIWHNNDRTHTQTVAENLQTLGWVTRNIDQLRYEEVRRQETPSGFVQQHVLRGIARNGAPVEIDACIVCRVENGRITRLDEYLDSAQLESLRRR
jgi:ketosteroid isomerase-like protein